MSNRNKVALLIVCLMLVFALSYLPFIIQYRLGYLPLLSNKDAVNTQTKTNLGLTKIELADTENKREQGLMYRQSLCQSCAMLFVFPDSQIRSFWMKNTLIPLDMVFIEENGKISNIQINAIPNQTDPSYYSKTPVKYVLETNGNYTSQIKLQENDVVDIQSLLKNTVPFEGER